MRVKCEYCDCFVEDVNGTCPNCGAVMNLDASGQIMEIKEKIAELELIRNISDCIRYPGFYFCPPIGIDESCVNSKRVLF